jgi:hypothetical protein
VHLVDPVADHVAKTQAARPAPASAVVGEARRLPQPDRFADAVLLLGEEIHAVAWIAPSCPDLNHLLGRSVPSLVAAIRLAGADSRG